ncbi:MAG TPA: hypothetical protein VGP93_16305, partial [Polyangiaceae bacterium]|nr:hypothetical protein [Polyangiaceae bacterium]
STAQAKAFIADVRAALGTPLVVQDAALDGLKQAFKGLRARTWLGAGDAAVAACSGELGIAQGSSLPDLETDAGRTLVNGWLERALGSDNSSFAAVGPAPWLDTTGLGLEASEAWPRGTKPEDSWPERDALHVDFVSDGPRRLSLAMRVADSAAALLAADQLGRPASALALRLAALPAAFRVERAAATVRARGACLRVDLSGARAEPGPNATQVAKAVLVTDEEMALTLSQASGSTLQGAVARASDPRDAAASAAWRALATQSAPANPRRTVGYVAHAAERGDLMLAPAIEGLQKGWSRSTLDLLTRDERGQGELWILLASPCGTVTETTMDSGRHALLVRSLARDASGSNEVELEPWITPDSIGLLAHAAPRDSGESSAALARRVGAALGRTLLAVNPQGATVAAARSALLDDVGAQPMPGYWLAIEALSPGHPAWLEPRGTFAALSDNSRASIEAERRALLSGPLRMAVLTNAGPAQSTQARDALERWLRAERVDLSTCAEVARTAPRSGEFTLNTTPGSEHEGAYLAMPLPALSGTNRLEAEATVWLLNRPGGWLEQALRGLSAQAQARAMGGTRAAGLVVRVVAPEDSEAAAIAELRSLFERLSRGAVSADEVVAAAKELGRAELESSLDPRRRVVDLWRAAGPPRPLDLASLRAFHARLGSASQALVLVRSRQ